MRALHCTLMTLSLGFAALFTWMFYERYWLWRSCFNDLGRCWDPAGEQVYVEGAGVIWGGMAVVSALIGVVCLLLALRRRSRM